MTTAHTLARLPDELIVEIFRQKVLSRSDLYNCALVSRKYTEAAQQSLFEEGDIMIVQHYYGVPNPGLTLKTKYAKRTWSLLKSLVDNERLAHSVRSLRFEIEKERGFGTDEVAMPLRTTPLLTLSTFLDVAPFVRSVHFGKNWTWIGSSDKLKALEPYEEICELSLDELSVEEEDYLARHLGQIDSLRITSFRDELFLSRTPSTIRRVAPFVALDYPDPWPRSLLPFLASDCLRLETLKINFYTARTFDYSELEVLHTLELYPSLGMSNPSNTDEVTRRQSKFWKRLCKSPSLRTLSFVSTEPQSPTTPDGLFPIFAPNSTWPPKPIPTLRTIRFKGDVILDRVLFILSSPIAQTLTRLVVPSKLARKGPESGVEGDEVKLKAIVGMCEGTGIEVYLADDYGRSARFLFYLQ